MNKDDLINEVAKIVSTKKEAVECVLASIQKSYDSAKKGRFHTLGRLAGPAKRIRSVFFIIFLLFAFSTDAQLQTKSGKRGQAFDRWDTKDEGMKTGPAVGETIPKFETEDQNGKLTSFQDIAGPKGAVILFHRSADW